VVFITSEATSSRTHALVAVRGQGHAACRLAKIASLLMAGHTLAEGWVSSESPRPPLQNVKERCCRSSASALTTLLGPEMRLSLRRK